MDQFLEHIYSYCEDIVRVGGRSKSEILKDHTLYELKKAHERPRDVGRLYRTRDDVGKELRNTIIELYEEPCVTVGFIASINGLKPRQLECLKRISEREKNRSSSSAVNSFINNDADSDDDWEISSAEPVKPKIPQVNNNSNNKKNGPQARINKNTHNNYANTWAGGNPNKVETAKEKQPNPVEIWLKEAIEYVGDAGGISTFAEEMKQSLLEQEKGLVFADDPDERDLIEEEELKEVQMEFRGDDDRASKSAFIQIGKSYRKQTETGPGEREERKIVNYQKIKTAATFEVCKFNFFEDTIDENVFEEDNNKYSLDRWMKEDDLSMWPLPVRLKAHKKWIEERNRILEAKLNMLMKKYYALSADIRKLMAEYEAKICKENRVVGMTSTAAVSTKS